MEKKPHKKDELSVVNNVLKLATKLMKVNGIASSLAGSFSARFIEWKVLNTEENFIVPLISTRSWILRSGCWAWPSTLWSITSPEWSSYPLSLLWSAISWASTSEWASFFWFLLILLLEWAAVCGLFFSADWTVNLFEFQLLKIKPWCEESHTGEDLCSRFHLLCKACANLLTPDCLCLPLHVSSVIPEPEMSLRIPLLITGASVAAAYISHTTNAAPDLWPLTPECLSLIN